MIQIENQLRNLSSFVSKIPLFEEELSQLFFYFLFFFYFFSNESISCL